MFNLSYKITFLCFLAIPFIEGYNSFRFQQAIQFFSEWYFYYYLNENVIEILNKSEANFVWILLNKSVC